MWYTIFFFPPVFGLVLYLFSFRGLLSSAGSDHPQVVSSSLVQVRRGELVGSLAKLSLFIQKSSQGGVPSSGFLSTMLFGRSLKSHFHRVRLFAGQRVTAEYINYRLKKIQVFFFFLKFQNQNSGTEMLGVPARRSGWSYQGVFAVNSVWVQDIGSASKTAEGKKKWQQNQSQRALISPQFLMGILCNRNDISIEDRITGFFNYIK